LRTYADLHGNPLPIDSGHTDASYLRVLLSEITCFDSVGSCGFVKKSTVREAIMTARLKIDAVRLELTPGPR